MLVRACACVGAHVLACYMPNPSQPLQTQFCPAMQDLDIGRAVSLLACLYTHGALRLPRVLS